MYFLLPPSNFFPCNIQFYLFLPNMYYLIFKKLPPLLLRWEKKLLLINMPWQYQLHSSNIIYDPYLLKNFTTIVLTKICWSWPLKLGVTKVPSQLPISSTVLVPLSTPLTQQDVLPTPSLCCVVPASKPTL